MFRKIYDQMDEILNNEKIVFIVGPRQVGKTTFMKKILDSLKTQDKQFLNLENFEYHNFFKSFSNFQSFVASNYSGSGKYFLFLDEFQKVKGIDNILKLIYDEMPFVKVILSGSNNIEINKNIKESFAGRKRVYNMFPLDFDEFLIWKENIDSENLESFKRNLINKNKILNYVEEFMTYGGYPEVVLAKNNEEKKQILSDIFDFWFNRDIVIYTQKLFEFKELTKQLSFRIGNTINYTEIASLSNLSSPTVKSFIEVLKETFIVFTQKPFFNNKLKEINKSPKLYFYDFGFRNWFINRFDFSSEEKGILFENMILSEFIKKGYNFDSLKFWRTNDEKYEVDLVFDLENKIFEFKYKDELKQTDKRGIEKFKELYPDFEGKIIYKENFLEII
ncbi:MAG: ATP-binding protein [Candidatus Gracilibacteria bacterium]|nr:ATP-binding protein [Candidatus Gracilibacteria bacterium]